MPHFHLKVVVEVVAADPGGEQVLDLPVGVLGFGGYAGVSDQFGHRSFESVSQPIAMAWCADISCDTWLRELLAAEFSPIRRWGSAERRDVLQPLSCEISERFCLSTKIAINPQYAGW